MEVECFMNDAANAILKGYLKIAQEKNSPKMSAPANINPNKTVLYHSRSRTSDSDESDEDSLRTPQRYSTYELSTMGLKMVACGIPRRSHRSVKQSKKRIPDNQISSLNCKQKLISENSNVKELEKNYFVATRARNHEQLSYSDVSPRRQNDSETKLLPENLNGEICENFKWYDLERPDLSNIPIKPPTYKNSSEINDSSKMLCVTVKGSKYYEIITDHFNIQQQLKNLPMLSNIIPDVDGKEKVLNYSEDAVKTVLGLLFSPSYNFNAIRNETTAVEILAIFQSWEIIKLPSSTKFKEYFFQNILKERNASKIYLLANHYNLDDVKKACSQFVKEVAPRKHKEKSCSIAVSTYVDPLEFCIPLMPTMECLSESFDRDIINDLIFESVSGEFVLTGFQITLNVNDKNDKSSKLKIDYSVESSSKNLNIPETTVFKYLSSNNFIYFKQKLNVKSGEKLKITVETHTKPCLCCVFKSKNYEEETQKGKFSLNLVSNRRVLNSDQNLFIIGGLFYH